MLRRVLLCIIVLICLTTVQCDTLHDKYTHLKERASELVQSLKSDTATDTNAKQLVQDAESLMDDAHKSLHKYTTTPDSTSHQSVYDRLHTKYEQLKQSLSDRREANKKAYVNTANSVKDAVHHYVDEIAPGTKPDTETFTQTLEPSLYEKVRRHAEKMYEKAKNTIEIGGDKYTTLDSITLNAKKYEKKLQNIASMTIDEKIETATQLTKLQKQVEQFIADKRGNTENFNRVESTRTMITDSQKKLQKDDAKIYSQSIKASVGGTLSKAGDAVKHTVESVHSTVAQPGVGAGTADEIVDRVGSPSVLESLVTGVASGIGNVYNDAKQQAEHIKQTGHHHHHGGAEEEASSTAGNTLTSQFTGAWESAKQKLNELTGGSASDKASHLTETTKQQVQETGNSLFDTISNKFNDLRGVKPEPLLSKPTDTGFLDSIKSKFNELTGSGNSVTPAQAKDLTIVDRIQNYYSNIYNQVSGVLNSVAKPVNKNGAGTTAELVDKQGKSPFESMLSWLGMREPEHNFD